MYAVSKIFGEALGRFYAEITDLSVICLRIGFVTGTPRPDNGNWRRMWLSPTDLGHLVRTSLATLLHYGVSANKPLRYDLERPRKDFGYQPADDSTDF